MLDFSRPLLFLAPLAGYTDLPFRSVVKRFGADVTVSEMISTNALQHRNAKTRKMIEKSPLETPYSVQIAGNDPEVVRDAVEFLNEEEGIDIIDLNAGCPVPKIVKNGAGSALLQELRNLESVATTIKKHSQKRYFSIKTRLGFTQKKPVEIAKVAEASGADFIVIHARTRADGFRKERIDYDSVRKIKESVNIPVVANGDIDSYEQARHVLLETGCDGLMIGRGAVGRPWVFLEIKNGVHEIDLATKKAIVLEHFDRMVEFYGELGVRMFRKHLHTYSKGLQGASDFRDSVNRIDEEQRIRCMIEEFFTI